MTLVVTAPIRPGSPRYREKREEDDQAVTTYGVPLAPPTAGLLVSAEAYAECVAAAIRARTGRERQNDYGVAFIDAFAAGHVAAELFANYYGTTALRREGEQLGIADPGWDVELGRRPLRIDVKLRQAFLTLRPCEYHERADFYALVQQRHKDAPYIFCGVIRPAHFYARRFDYYCECPQWAVTAAALMPPTHFHPFDC